MNEWLTPVVDAYTQKYGTVDTPNVWEVGSRDGIDGYDFTMQGSTYTNITTTNGTITNSTNADAQFIDPASNDFRLKPTSPAIDRGIVI